MERLLNIGFKKMGYWTLEEENIKYALDSMMNSKNVLYAFICNGEVKYIGKTVQKLKNRMNGYKNPGKSQVTNIKNNKNIFESLKKDEAIDIFALSDNGLMHYGGFHINLAAGLEDDLIRQIDPEWNGGSRIAEQDTEKEETAAKNGDSLISGIITLHQTYYNQGFFNLTVDLAQYVGGDKENIEIHFYDSQPSVVINGYINRTANANKTPRIMGGKKLKNIFQKKFTLNEQIQIYFLSKNAIRLSTFNQ